MIFFRISKIYRIFATYNHFLKPIHKTQKHNKIKI